MKTPSVCPIWGTPASVEASGGLVRVDSPRAGGGYSLSLRAAAVLTGREPAQEALLTSWLVDQRRLGNSCPHITLDVVESTKRLRPRPVQDRADGLLRILGERTTALGEPVVYTIVEHWIAYPPEGSNEATYGALLAHSESLGAGDFLFLVEYLADRGFVRRQGTNNESQSCVVTFQGYARIEKLVKVHAASTTAFVAMWFDESMETAWSHGIRPAIEAAGYRPVRVDQDEHIDKLDDRIISEIRRCRFLVADFTQGEPGARGGVYYEAGFAQGLDLPVIFTCRKDVLCKVHFDTRQYNHITWTEPEELRERLERRICAVIGDGPFRIQDEGG